MAQEIGGSICRGLGGAGRADGWWVLHFLGSNGTPRKAAGSAVRLRQRRGGPFQRVLASHWPAPQIHLPSCQMCL